jgi:hypothetical protein
MIKKILLASSVLSLAFASNAAEKEFYVIKDGKMVNCEFIPSSTSTIENSYEVYETQNSKGEDMVLVKNPDTLYKSAFLYLPEAIDLSEAWNLVFEYYFEEGTELTDNCYKKECWKFDLLADTTSVKGAKFNYSPSQKEYRIAHVSIDSWFRDFYTYDGKKSVLDNHGVGEVRSVTKYVYSNPLLPAEVAERGDGNKVKVIYLAMFPESGAEIKGYIKNLKFVSDGTKPFYADKMTLLGGEGTIFAKSIDNYVYGTNGGKYNDAKIGELEYVEGELKNPTKMYGQQLFVSNSLQGDGNKLDCDRMYCDYGEQGGVDFLDSEYGFLPYMGKAIKDARLDIDGVVADAQLRIPLGDAVDKTISIAMRLGHNAGTTGGKTPYADYKADSKDIRFPVEYRFESGDAQTISSKTDWKQFTPSYEKGGKDLIDSIPPMMSMVYGDVELPSKEYTYITLRFIPNDVISYMFGDIRLTGDTKSWPKKAKDFELGEDYLGYKIPTSFHSDVKNIVAKGEISIYPNPATDVITVTNEGVNSVAVYSVAGSLVASSESNVVNVANLVKGIYVVKANTEAGVITGQIIKK